MADNTHTTDILFEELHCKRGILGIITLNRPKSLNALTHTMIKALENQLEQWEKDSAIKAVFIESNSEKAFCAGGDIAYVYHSKQKGQIAKELFKDEYRLNRKIHEYSKPYIAFLDGITMGGGVGISIHGSHRIGTEKLILSMPEAGIGFFPDVGASYFLSRCQNELGLYAGLTSARLNVVDAIYLGLIDYQIPSDQLPAIKQSLLTTSLDFEKKEVIHDILSRHSIKPSESTLLSHTEAINTIFSAQHVEEIFDRLTVKNNTFSQETLTALKTKSPISLKVTREEMLRGKNQTIAECLAMEYGLAKNFLHSHDFFEGIRAAIIDKDRMPHWNPPSLEEISDKTVKSFFNDSDYSEYY